MDRESPTSQSKSQALRPGYVGPDAGASPTTVHLKAGHAQPKKKQNPVQWEALLGISPVIQSLTDQGLFRPCLSAYISPSFQKETQWRYRMAQDLGAVREATEDTHPVVPNATPC